MRLTATARGIPPCRSIVFLLLFLCFLTLSVRAVPQFDPFIGYDGVVPEASWFPVVIEVKNDGPTFTGVIEISGGMYNNQGQVRRVVVELPTGTLKRLTIPVFSAARYQSSWDVRLLDERGRIHAEQVGVRSKRQVADGTVLLGALPRTANGVPVIRKILPNDSEIQPATARIQAELFPDNPLVLDGMTCFYLNSDKAVSLNDNQVIALKAWVKNGGHLIIGVEQITDVNSTFLRTLVPCDLKDQLSISNHLALNQWVRGSAKTETPAEPTPTNKKKSPQNRIKPVTGYPFTDLPEDGAFEDVPIQVSTGIVHGADVIAASDGVPLILRTGYGRGRITALMFSPEREPFRSWKNQPSFWARMTEVPPGLYVNENANSHGGWSVDGVFGAMIDSKQVRKLPVEWLLLLLIVYLVVIGPFDQYWLKRIRRPMLTWITFPCYVVLFSLLIYFIGYKLRAGESEWNELHLVDILPWGEGAELRGRTYASIYSPVNQKYRVEGQDQFSTFRSEFQGSWSGGQESERADVMQNGNNYKAEIFVPVWTSQLFVSDWWEQAEMPIKASVVADGNNWSVSVRNQLTRPVTHIEIVINNRLVDLGELAAGQSKQYKVTRDQGTPIGEYVWQHGGNFQNVMNSRQHAFGSSGSGRIVDLPNATTAASFISKMSQQQGHFEFLTPPGLDLSPSLDQGNAVILAWSSDYSPIRDINRFSPRRSHKDTLWRMTVPVITPTS